MATFDALKTSWTASDVSHFARRAGFGVSPEIAAGLAAQPVGATVDAWVDGAGASWTAFNAALAANADVVSYPQVPANSGIPGSQPIPADPAPHPFRLESWRQAASGQSHWAWRMQYSPYPFQERLALFWHNFFATGFEKVRSLGLVQDLVQLYRDHGLDGFPDLLVLVSKDAAMSMWLDSVLNQIPQPANNAIPNENYAREVLELYSLGVDNGYNQTDITELAKALSGWSFTVKAADIEVNPVNQNPAVRTGTFAVYRGQNNPDGRDYAGRARATLPNIHFTGTVNFLGQTFNAGAATAYGADIVRAIPTLRANQCSEFLAKRILVAFVTPTATATALQDLAALIRAQNFNLRAVFKALFKSAYFFDPAHRHALAEGPVSWIVRGARALALPFAQASAAAPYKYPAWTLFANVGFEQAGMRFLDSDGPNGWEEHTGWINSNAMRWRGKFAAALAIGENVPYAGNTYDLFPSNVAAWFPAPPTSGLDVYNRLIALLQPAPIPTSVRDSWLTALFPGAFAWDATAQTGARRLAYLILCSPGSQLY
jgi:uncharacterized protein (DUF1800 family)